VFYKENIVTYITNMALDSYFLNKWSVDY